MFILKHNTLTHKELSHIEAKYTRWLNSSKDSIELNVLDCEIVDLYGYLLAIFSKLEIPDTLNISLSTLLDFFIDVRHSYHDTLYHSFYHATDVVVVLYYIMVNLKANKYFTNLEIALLFLSAICHDAGHMGYNNDYYVKLNTDLAKRYNNKSVLESLSVELAFDILDKHDIIKQKEERSYIKQLILSTDMQHHYELSNEMNSLEDILTSINLWEEEDSKSLANSILSDVTTLSSADQINPLDKKQRLSFACILLHAADISNTVRSWPISKQWSDLIVQEFFCQGDAEKEAGLPVSPGMDREVATQASISIKFSDFIVKPYFDQLTNLLPCARCFIETLHENRQEWFNLSQAPLATSISTYANHNMNVPAGTVLLPFDHHRHIKTLPISVPYYQGTH